MNTKKLFFGFLTAMLALTPVATLKYASAVEQFNYDTHTKTNLIACGGGAATAGDLAIGAAQLGLQIDN